MEIENQKQKKQRKEKTKISDLPKEKVGVLLSINLFEIKENIQKILSQVENYSLEVENPKKNFEMLQSYLKHSLSNSIKEVKKISDDISTLYDVGIKEKDMKCLYELKKALTKVSPDNISNFMELVSGVK